jgi:aldehyde dehydrogenase
MSTRDCTEDRDALVAGAQVDSPDRIEIRNPARTSSVVGSVPACRAADVDRAVAAAHAAFRGWSRMPKERRAACLRDGAQTARIAAEDRAVTLVRESGKVLVEARGEIRAALAVLEYYAALAAELALSEELASPTGRVIVAREAMGVAAVIVPWNAPVLLTAYAIAPALAAGNTVVVKPSSEAPLAVMGFLEAVARHLPAGVLNVITGPSDVLGERLVTHPLVRRIMFTGSTEVGRAVAAAATSSLKRVTMELGGNDPAIVLHDADLAGDVVPEIVRGVYATTGQVCYAIKRIYVHRSLYADFVDAFTAASDALVVGDGLDPQVDMGPVINRASLRRLDDLVAETRELGATVVQVGRGPEHAAWEEGCFHLPTVVTGADHSFGVVSGEQFGPVIPILAFDSDAQAVAMANDSNFGLASSIWTSDEERGFALAREIEAGTTFVNVHRVGASGPDMPFGGVKESGIGRGHGLVALEEQFELHTVSSRRPTGPATT